jgi:hypothetical protein
VTPGGICLLQRPNLHITGGLRLEADLSGIASDSGPAKVDIAGGVAEVFVSLSSFGVNDVRISVVRAVLGRLYCERLTIPCKPQCPDSLRRAGSCFLPRWPAAIRVQAGRVDPVEVRRTE